MSASDLSAIRSSSTTPAAWTTPWIAAEALAAPGRSRRICSTSVTSPSSSSTSAPASSSAPTSSDALRRSGGPGRGGRAGRPTVPEAAMRSGTAGRGGPACVRSSCSAMVRPMPPSPPVISTTPSCAVATLRPLASVVAARPARSDDCPRSATTSLDAGASRLGDDPSSSDVVATRRVRGRADPAVTRPGVRTRPRRRRSPVERLQTARWPRGTTARDRGRRSTTVTPANSGGITRTGPRTVDCSGHGTESWVGGTLGPNGRHGDVQRPVHALGRPRLGEEHQALEAELLVAVEEAAAGPELLVVGGQQGEVGDAVRDPAGADQVAHERVVVRAARSRGR